MMSNPLISRAAASLAQSLSLEDRFDLVSAINRASTIDEIKDPWKNKISELIDKKTSFKKHGDHDQSSHGSWAHGVSVAPEVVRSTLDRVKENGGLSVNLKDGSEPTKGFMVAKGKKFAAIVKADEFFDEAKGAEILSSYMKQHKAEFNNSNNYLGLWHNTEDGQVYLDVSENIQDEAEATSRGRERDQISIWDVANFKEIPTGGTGGIEKTRGGSTSRYIEDDRRRDRQLRQRNLGEVGKAFSATKVIYFEYGLKPVLKHGEHDQSEHGNWARGYTDEERTRMEAMKDRGPSIDDLNNVMSDPRDVEDSEIRLMVENDRDMYEAIQERVQERLADRQYEISQMSESEQIRVQEQMTEMVTNEYIEDNRDELAERIRIEEGSYSENDPQDLQPYFDEVYGVSHTGTNPDGTEHTLNSQIYEVSRDGKNLYVRGVITNEDGEEVGEVARRFFQRDGVWAVEHEVLAIGDEEYRGTGFGQELIKQSEAWYTAKGFGYIEVGTAWDGARHWARAGYDFRPDKLDENFEQLRMNIEYVDGFERGTPARAEFDALMSRATNGYQPDFEDESGNKFPAWDSIKDMKADNFPLPADFANIGYTKGARDWAGRRLMDGLRMKYTKVLTAEGQKLLDGPIDHDGDGMIYDGTAREKPAPGGGNK